MELRMNEFQLPEQISFNYEELKQELTEKVSMYETLVYTDEQIKDAKADRANLNKLKKALNDERIRLEKEYMIPFNNFKKEINEIIAIIDKPVAVIDSQVKQYEQKQKEEKIAQVKEYFESLPVIEGFETLAFEQIFNPRWENASCSMRAIQDEISGRINNIKSDLATLQNLPEFGFEATEVYKTTLDLSKAISEGQRLSEIAKRKAEQERLAFEAEFAKNMNPPVEETVEGQIEFTDTKTFDENVLKPIASPEPAKQWISFKACLTVEQATELRQFFESRNIEFEAI